MRLRLLPNNRNRNRLCTPNNYDETDSYHEHEPFNVNVPGDDIDFVNDDIEYARTNVPASETLKYMYVLNVIKLLKCVQINVCTLVRFT